MRSRRLLVVSGAAIIVGGCSPAAPTHRRTQNVLDPSGTGARIVADEFWFNVTLGAAVFVLLATIVGIALVRRSARRLPPGADVVRSERRWIWLGGIVLPLVVLSAVFIVSLRSSSALWAVGQDSEEPLEIRVTAHQWWWEVEYPAEGIVTANEIRVPVGRAARIELQSIDVIHSFWVPNIHPKLDMVPGESTNLTIFPEQSGIYRGACAEFCGLQHARMQFLLVVMPQHRFRNWTEDATRPSDSPPGQSKGEEVFMRAGCANCHARSGSPAYGGSGPDLTLLHERLTLGAGILENNPGNLGGWIADPQRLKPGVQMPATDLSGEDLTSLIDYLRSMP